MPTAGVGEEPRETVRKFENIMLRSLGFSLQHWGRAETQLEVKVTAKISNFHHVFGFGGLESMA